MKPALLVIDMQQVFTKSDLKTAQSFTDAIAYINAAIALFRANGLPIFCIEHMNKGEEPVPGVDVFELPEQLNILPSDRHIHKTYGNSFNKTPLHSQLCELGVDTLIITGYCAEFCVLATYRGAEDLDLTPILLRGSLASGSAENIKFVENVSDVISYGALRKVLAAA